jgi:Cu/Zn superoxide dismutase
VPHGSFELNTYRHNGDMTNNLYFNNGLTYYSFHNDMISLYSDDPRYIIGRSIVIHQDFDDEGLNFDDDESLITGNAGARIACANIIKME